MSVDFCKSPFECLNHAANNDGMAIDSDISARSAGIIIKFINKHRSNLNLDLHDAAKESEARVVLLKLVRDGDIDEEHPIFHNWPKLTGALKTAFTPEQLLSKPAQSKKVYRTALDPATAWLNVATSHEFSGHDDSESNEVDKLSAESQKTVHVGLSQKITRTPARTQSKSSKKSSKSPKSVSRRSASTGSSILRTSEVADMLTTVNASLLKEFKEQLSTEITTVYSTLEKTKNTFTAELDDKASKNYVRGEMNRMNTKVDEIKSSLAADIAALPKHAQVDTASHPSTGSIEFNSLAAKVEELERTITTLKSRVFPTLSEEYLAAQIDNHQIARAKFLFAVNGQKRSGYLYIGVPAELFRKIDDKNTEINLDKVSQFIGVNFAVSSKISVNFHNTRASCKIKIRDILPGDRCQNKVDEIMTARQNIQQSSGITIQVSIVHKYHFGHTLRAWIEKKYIFNFENTKSGQYRIFIGDGENELTTAKARNRSCSDLIIDNPMTFFNMREPSIANFLKIKTGKFFVCETGDILEVPDKFMWMFESYETRTAKNSIGNSNSRAIDTRPHSAFNANPPAPGPAALNTVPLNDVASKLFSSHAKPNNFGDLRHFDASRPLPNLLNSPPDPQLPPVNTEQHELPVTTANVEINYKEKFEALSNLFSSQLQNTLANPVHSG